MDVLIRIKRAVLAGHYRFSMKARIEMEIDGLTELDVVKSILNAPAIYKRLRSTSPSRNKRREYLYVIQSTNLGGLVVYTKGTFGVAMGTETYYARNIKSETSDRNVAGGPHMDVLIRIKYFFVSSKRAM